jgi:importin subunit beta-1
MLIELLKDSSVVVRDTAAWTVGRVCELLPDSVIDEKTLNPLLHALVEGLTAEPRVASNVSGFETDFSLLISQKETVV